MPTILGFFTALFVVAWGTRWYLSRTSRDWPATLRRVRAALVRLRTLATPPQREATAPAAPSRPEPERGGEVVIEGEISPAPTPVSASVEVEEMRPPRAAPAPSAAPPEIIIEASPSPVAVEPPLPSPVVEIVSAEAATVPEEKGPALDEVGAAWQEVAELAAPAAEGSEGQEGEAVTESVIGFCARCRDKRPVAQPTRTRTKKGKPAIRGQCSVCGAGMFVFTGG